MTKHVRWSGILSIPGGIMFPFAFLLHLFRATDTFYTPVHVLVGASMVLLLLGLPGLYFGQKARMRDVGLIGVLIACIGTIMQVGYFLVDGFLAPRTALFEPSSLYAVDVHLGPLGIVGQVAIVVLLCELCFAVGYLMFAMETLRAHVFPFWAGLVLLSGALLFGAQILLPPFVAELGAALFGLGFIEMGYVLFFEGGERAALGRCKPQADLLHHSDQGSEYTSDTYLAVLTNWGIQFSMSRTGNFSDNAVMERFFGTLKRECPIDFETHQQARSAIFEYIESFYNWVRRHSTLDYLSPVDFELSKR